MKNYLTSYERREIIKTLLLNEKSTTTMRLTYLFGVSRQTIQRDIDFLSRRMPIVTKAGNGGGVFLNMNYRAPKEHLSEDEKTLLLNLSETLCGKDKLIMTNIINKFSFSCNE